MGDILSQYMSNRLGEISLNDHKIKSGPIISISRMAGCSSQRLAKALAVRLNEMQGVDEWSVISKEILRESAHELHLHPKRIKSVFHIKDRTVLDDIAQAFMSVDYHLECKMRKTVIAVIKQFAIAGHKIILGRAANIICSDIKNALHIRINAPIEWRIERIMQSKNMNRNEALGHIEEIECNRKNFRTSIKEKKLGSQDFDLTINQSKFTNKEIIEIIIKTMEIKNIK